MASFRLCRQHDTMQCGAACLQMICKHYGKNFSLEYLDNLCSVSKDGVSVESISKAAITMGLEPICGFVDIEKLKFIDLPLIIYWGQNHFVVLYKIKRTITGKHLYYIADPGFGFMKYSTEEFSGKWISDTTVDAGKRGIVIALNPNPEFYTQEDERQKKYDKSSLRILWQHFRYHKKYLSQVILGLIAGCIIQFIFPFLTQSIVDIGIDNKDLTFVYIILMAQLAFILGNVFIDFTRRWLLLHVGMKINISLVSDFFIKLLKLPMRFFDIKLIGDIIERIHDHKRVEEFLTTHFLTAIFAGLSFIVLSIILLHYNTLIFAVFLVGNLLYAIWLSLFLNKRRTLDYMLFEKRAQNDNKIYEFIRNMQEIKLQGCERRQRWHWEDIQADTFDIEVKMQKIKQQQDVGAFLIRETQNIIIMVLSASAVISGEITIGIMIAIQFILGQLRTPIDGLLNLIYALQDVKVSLDRIGEIHNIEDEDHDDATAINLELASDRNISLNNIDFRYDKSTDVYTLKDVSIEIPFNKVTAIVGHSGSGKSTLLKLILGYYSVEKGNIKVGGYNIDSINKRDWRNKCGIVMQNGAIFSESIARNIAADDNEIKIEQVKKAAKIACISDFIETLPLKYNTVIGEDGIDLSQGQKQRLLIARAVYKSPPFIFLDEATNSLDADNENLIVHNLSEVYNNKTVIVIAHRLSTVMNADKIIVLHKGRIVEIGNHTELIARRGRYYRLVKNQLELGE